MIYYSVDVETTGLDPEEDQILEIGGVEMEFGGQEPLSEFHSIIYHDRIVGDPFALSMHSDLLREISNLKNVSTIPYKKTIVMRGFSYWVSGGTNKKEQIFAGKNFDKFDRRFLVDNLGMKQSMFHHRTLDPTLLYMHKLDSVPPSLGECVDRASITRLNEHRALSDARTVVSLIEKYYNTEFRYPTFKFDREWNSKNQKGSSRYHISNPDMSRDEIEHIRKRNRKEN